ncbi:MAG: hypothetical protein AAF787_05240 [Chloroflexota bacterium]
MPTQSIFTWRDGGGWLVLSGGTEPTGAIRAKVIERLDVDGALAVIVLDDAAAADDVLNDMQELGGPAGYLVNAMTEDDNTIKQQLTDAAIVVVSSSAPPREVKSYVLGAVIAGVEAAHDRGAIILAEGTAASVFGAYLLDGETVVDGINWLEHAGVLPESVGLAETAAAQIMMAEYADVIMVGISVGAALAFGDTLEAWGNKQITIAPGTAYSQ